MSARVWLAATWANLTVSLDDILQSRVVQCETLCGLHPVMGPEHRETQGNHHKVVITEINVVTQISADTVDKTSISNVALSSCTLDLGREEIGCLVMTGQVSLG